MAKKDENKYGNLPKKWVKVLDNLQDDDFLEKAQQSSKEELSDIIVKCNENLAEIKKDMDADQDLAEKKQAVKDAAAVYKEGIAVNEAKAMYCVYLKNSL